MDEPDTRERWNKLARMLEEDAYFDTVGSAVAVVALIIVVMLTVWFCWNLA